MIVEILLIAVCLLYLLCYILALNEPDCLPLLYAKDLHSSFMQEILKSCPVFQMPYIPTYLWGKNCHIQTWLYSRIGRVNAPTPTHVRCHCKMKDGTTIAYDVFNSYKKHPTDVDVTMLVCPGMANSSESRYISSFANYSQVHGFRVAVINSLGALNSVKLTSPRIFTYGGTDELHHVVVQICEKYPDTKLVLVGFSLGGNLVLKYLGEGKSHQHDILCGISVCQGYDANKARPFLMSWERMRRFYLFAMADHMKCLLRRHYDKLLATDIKKQYDLDEKNIFSSTSLVEFDEFYSRRVAGFASVDEFYDWCSCGNYLHNIQVPTLLVNAEDDPLVPAQLWDIGKNYSESTNRCLCVITKHGGHLGFFEGGFLYPKTIAWCDKASVQFASAVVSLYSDGKLQDVKESMDKQNGFMH